MQMRDCVCAFVRVCVCMGYICSIFFCCSSEVERGGGVDGAMRREEVMMCVCVFFSWVICDFKLDNMICS